MCCFLRGVRSGVIFRVMNRVIRGVMFVFFAVLGAMMFCLMCAVARCFTRVCCLHCYVM